MAQEPTYTAEELARAINRELGTSLKARTVYFYRSRDVLSPLVMAGNQPKFTERHRLELKAILALQGTFDRPSLDEIRAKLEGLGPDELAQVAELAPPRSGEVLRQATTRPPLLPVLMEARAPAFHACEVVSGGQPSWKTIVVSPEVSLRLRSDLPRSFVTGLVRRVAEYCKTDLKEDLEIAQDWSPDDKERYSR